MFKEMKSRRLALLVAVALGGGGFLSSAQNVSAADVVIDDAHSTVAADHMERQAVLSRIRPALRTLQTIRSHLQSIASVVAFLADIRRVMAM